MKMHFTKMLSVCCAIALGVFMSTETLAQGGETCATAEVITPGSFTAGDLVGAGYENFCGDGTPGENARWYSYTPASDGFMTISSCGGGADTRLSVGTGACGAVVCFANTDDDCEVSPGGFDFAAELANLAVTAGTTYLIEWDDRWDFIGFDWTLEFFADLPLDCEGTPGGTVGEGDPCDDGNDLTFNDVYDENCNCAGTQECTGTPGGTTGPGADCDDGNPDTFGDVYDDNCMCAGFPLGDGASCADAIVIDPGTYTTEAMVGGDGYQDICGDGTPGANARWYAFTPPSDGTMSISSCNGGSDTRLSVGTGDCGALACFANSDDVCAVVPDGLNFAAELVDLAVTGGTTYYIQWDDRWDGQAFTFTLTFVSNTPPCELGLFPPVDESSLSSMEGPGLLTVSWAAIPGQIGCRVEGRPVGGPTLLSEDVPGAGASSLTLPTVTVPPGDYEWRVACACQVNPEIISAGFTSWQPVTITGSAPSISSNPNPTTGVSFVSFSVPTEGTASLEVYDMSGRVVDALFTGVTQPNNEYRFEFDGSDLPNGVYIYRLTTENEVINEKFMIAR